jgi:hypothetical protein
MSKITRLTGDGIYSSTKQSEERFVIGSFRIPEVLQLSFTKEHCGSV